MVGSRKTKAGGGGQDEGATGSRFRDWVEVEGLGCGVSDFGWGNYIFSIREVDIRLHGKGNSNFHGARPVYLNHPDNQVDSDQ